MKRSDFIFLASLAALFLPFACIDSCYQVYLTVTKEHTFLMGFLKFGILATMGEMLGLRIRKGCYFEKGFGIAPRAIVWGLLGVGITAAMMIFKVGTPKMVDYLFGFNGQLLDAMSVPDFSGLKLLGAFSISVMMNTLFAPIFMTAHKITDTHIATTGGTLRGFFSPIPVVSILQNLNWKVQVNFVFLTTIPLFWYPAHTITFLLPDTLQVLFAAILGVVLGVILSISANKKS